MEELIPSQSDICRTDDGIQFALPLSSSTTAIIVLIDTNWQNWADLGQYCCWSNYQWTTNLLCSGMHQRIRL